jgi:ABC-type spermidine/putrescine transport system permease subunit II
MSMRAERLFLIIVAIAVAAFVLAPLFLMFATSFKADENQILRDLGNANAFWVSPG